VNLAIWRLSLTDSITQSIESLMTQKPSFSTEIILAPNDAFDRISDCFDGVKESHSLCEHITLLVDMFCTLFELKNVGLRLKIIDQPMCPRFHVDKVPCRLISTLYGTGTQWLKHSDVNRGELGSRNNGLTDTNSGVIKPEGKIEQLSCGDIALLKGEHWHNNEQAGLVHRSPVSSINTRRLLLTLDFIS